MQITSARIEIARAVGVLVGYNCPEHPHLGPPPTPLPRGMGAHLSSGWGYAVVLYGALLLARVVG